MLSTYYEAKYAACFLRFDVSVGGKDLPGEELFGVDQMLQSAFIKKWPCVIFNFERFRELLPEEIKKLMELRQRVMKHGKRAMFVLKAEQFESVLAMYPGVGKDLFQNDEGVAAQLQEA